MVSYLTALGMLLLVIVNGVIFYFFLPLVLLGLCQVRRLCRRPEWRLVLILLLFFSLWRIGFWGALPDSASDRYALAVGVPLILFVAPGVALLLRWWKRTCRYPVVFFWLALIVIFGGANIAKSCRQPRLKTYLPEIATLLKPYERNGVCLDDTRELSRLAPDYNCHTPIIPLDKSRTPGDSERWRDLLDRNADKADHIFIVHELPDDYFLTTLQGAFGKKPVAKLGAWNYRDKTVALWEVSDSLNADWATPGRSRGNPNPCGLTLPEQIELPRGETLRLPWRRVMGDENWRNYVYSIDGPYGFLYGDGFYYRQEEGDPVEFTLTVTVRDAVGLETGRGSVRIRNVDAAASVAEIPEAKHFKTKAPADSDFRPFLAVPEVLWIRPGKIRIYLDSWLAMPDTRRFQWRLDGIDYQDIEEHFRGIQLTMPNHPLDLRLTLREIQGPVNAEITLHLLPVAERPLPKSGMAVISSETDRAPGSWTERLAGTDNHLWTVKSWSDLQKQLNAGDWRNGLQRLHTIIVDIPYYNTNFMPSSQLLAEVLEELLNASPKARILIGAPAPPVGTQDAWARYANQFQNNYFSDWKYRCEIRRLILDLQRQIASRGEKRAVLVFAPDIGEAADFPVIQDTLADREVVGNHFLLSQQGRKKMIDSLLLAASEKESIYE